MTYSFETRRKIRSAIRNAEKKDFITRDIQKRLLEAASLVKNELAHIESLLKKELK